MLDPYTYILLHKYQRLEFMKQANDARLHNAINQSTQPLQRIRVFSRSVTSRWTRRRPTTHENRLTDGEVVMP
jgi:hypothetical protein